MDDILSAQKEIDPEGIKRLFKRYLENPETFSPTAKTTNEKKSFSVTIEHLVDLYRNEWSAGHKKKYRSLKTKVLEFDPSFTIDLFSRSWLQNFIDHCLDERENAHNTIHADLKIFTQLFKLLNITRNDIVNWQYIEPRIEPLNWEEVKLIANLDLTDSYRATHKDSQFLWLTGAYMGLRWSDIVRLNRKSFVQKSFESEGKNYNIWHYSNRVQKGKKLIEIPLLEEAVSHLESRNWVIPQLSQQTVNSDIKEIAKVANINGMVSVQTVHKNQVKEELIPKHKRIHIHTGRHTYACEIARRSIGMPFADKFVSEMLGHASPTTTWKYMNLVQSNKDKMFLSILKMK